MKKGRHGPFVEDLALHFDHRDNKPTNYKRELNGVHMAEQSGQTSGFFDEATTPQASQEVERWRNNRQYRPPFRVIRWRVVDEQWEGRHAIDAVVIVEVRTP